ncbi:MAG: gliding motility-associated C-terminal domain-containing protein [Bacteroidetes bacterium]|uniref:T9SS type B sorting domain-containing protein n=1 Tax=Phnomibacter sp. TaxID=2836217 RepID=UPI002FDEA1B8|nr:gliding motility-associated C-terminal domain-containing protein [Bacteroidota bacterium]
MLRFFFLFLISVEFISAQAQLPLLQWAGSFVEKNTYNRRAYSNGRSIGTDFYGNVFSAGYFEGTIDFDPGPGVFLMTGGSPSQYGIYITKQNKNGELVWAKQIATYVEWGQIELKVDRKGNVVVASQIRNELDIDPGPGVVTLKPTGYMNALVVKFDTDGNLVWAKDFGGPGDTGAEATCIAINQQNEIVVCGNFNNTVDFNPGQGVYNITSSGHSKSFVVKLDEQGDFLLAVEFGNATEIYHGISVTDAEFDKQNNLVLTGGFFGTCDFDPGRSTYTLQSSTGSFRDGFICKFSNDLTGLLWAKAFSQSGGYNQYLTPMGIAIDANNHVIAGGFFNGNFDFNPGTENFSFVSKGEDWFVLKLDDKGDFLWAKQLGGSDLDGCSDVAVDPDNQIYLSGSFGKSGDADPGPGTFIVNALSYGSSLLIKLTEQGNFTYAIPYNERDATLSIRRLVVDEAYQIYAVGTVAGSIDVDHGPGMYQISGFNDSAPFVFKLGRCQNPTSANIIANTCDRYTIEQYQFDSSGIYKITIPNSAGCDSIITLNLTISKTRNSQTKTICQGDSILLQGQFVSKAGVYIDSLKTVFGCDSIVVTQLVMNPLPQPMLSADTSICSGSSILLSPGQFEQYHWQDGSTAAAISADAPGLYWVRVVNTYNCTAADSMRLLKVHALPSNFLKPTDSLCSYDKITLSASGTFQQYRWSTGESTAQISVERAGRYQLTVTDGNGCTGKDSMDVIAKSCIEGVYIPTAFTPNADGKNDKFRASVYARLSSFKLSVFNRFGQTVFETNDPGGAWDGRFAGQALSTGTYVWICQYTEVGKSPKSEKGTVVLIR